MIVGICGLAGSGKDASADALVDYSGFQKMALADPLKRICREVFDFSVEQLWGPSEERSKPDLRYPREHAWAEDGRCACCGQQPLPTMPPCHLTPRYALQTLGTEWGRDCYDPVWVLYAIRVAEKLLNAPPYYKGEKAPLQQVGGHFRYDQTKGILQDILYEGALPGVVIADVRFKNEIVNLRKARAKLIRVRRVGYEKPRWNHPSETEQMEIPDGEFDAVIENNSSVTSLLAQVVEKVRNLR